jgi:flagellar hook-associated protein 2
MIQAYNYMIESYLPKQMVRNNAHKKNELKKIYENIVKHSRNSGFYKINLSKENQEFTFGIKDAAIILKSKLTELSDSEQPSYHRRFAAVSDGKALDAKLVSEDVDKLPENIALTVESLASPQVNVGKDLFLPSRGLDKGMYDFRAYIKGKAYDLNFLQKEKTSNQDTIRRMADYLGQALPELSVTVEEGANKEYSRLRITSNFTGDYGERAFSFEDADVYREGMVDFFGLNHMENPGGNTHFTINGVEKQTNSNTFQIENTLQVTLNKVSNKAVTLRILNDPEKLLEQVDSALEAFNDMLHLADTRKEENGSFGAKKLINEIKGIEQSYQEELEANGLIAAEDGTLIRDEMASDLAAKNGSIRELFTGKNGFISKILGKAEEISINPMEYLDKTIVTYPNSKRTISNNPYMTSMYSGLFFSSYC